MLQAGDLGLEVLVLMIMTVACIVYRWKEVRKSAVVSKQGPIDETSSGASAQLKAETFKSPEGSHDEEVQGVFSPSGRLVHSNQRTTFENENCTGSFLLMHRPTHDPALDKSGQYPFADHFSGRKRLWEARVQLNFKHTPTEPVLFGIELDDYVPLPAASKRLMGVVVAALRRVVGNDLYHSVGDDPKIGTGPHEKPAFVMPLWAFDQFVVTPEGEEAPDLEDPRFHEFGTKRADDRAAFIKQMSVLELKTGPTYTFSFWGISQFLDQIKWEITGVIPFTRINFNQFCGKAPVHLVMYSLDRADDDKETRHLQSRKHSLFDLKFWSTKSKPTPERLQELMPDRRDAPTNTLEPSLLSKPIDTVPLPFKSRSCTGAKVRSMLATMCY